jgi:hypothetical protein
LRPLQRLRVLWLRVLAVTLCASLYPQCAPLQRVPSTQLTVKGHAGAASHIASGCGGGGPVPVAADLPAYEEDHVQAGAEVAVAYDGGGAFRAAAHVAYAVGALVSRTTSPTFASQSSPDRTPYHLGEAGAEVSLWTEDDIGVAAGVSSMWASAPSAYVVPFTRVHIGQPEAPWSGAVQLGPDHLLFDGRLIKGAVRANLLDDDLALTLSLGLGGRPMVMQDPALGGLVFGSRSRALLDLMAQLEAQVRLSNTLSLSLSINGGYALPAGAIGLTYAWTHSP